MSKPPCPECASALTYDDGTMLVCPECGHEWMESAIAAATEETPAIRDAFGTPLEKFADSTGPLPGVLAPA